MYTKDQPQQQQQQQTRKKTQYTSLPKFVNYTKLYCELL